MRNLFFTIGLSFVLSVLAHLQIFEVQGHLKVDAVNQNNLVHKVLERNDTVKLDNISCYGLHATYNAIQYTEN